MDHGFDCGCVDCNQVRVDAGYENWKIAHGYSDGVEPVEETDEKE